VGGGWERLAHLPWEQGRVIIDEQQVGDIAPRASSAASSRDAMRLQRVNAQPLSERTRPVGLACHLLESRPAERITHHHSFKRRIKMRLESTIIERVETFVHHPVFSGSDRTMNLVLDELESLERNGQIGQTTYLRLREMILQSPHIVSCR
jgi:hypothetical protein